MRDEWSPIVSSHLENLLRQKNQFAAETPPTVPQEKARLLVFAKRVIALSSRGHPVHPTLSYKNLNEVEHVYLLVVSAFGDQWRFELIFTCEC